MTAKAFELFMQGKTLAEVVVILNLEYDEAKRLYLQYLDSQDLQIVKFIV